MSRPEIKEGNALIGLFWSIILSIPLYALIFWAIWG